MKRNDVISIIKANGGLISNGRGLPGRYEGSDGNTTVRVINNKVYFCYKLNSKWHYSLLSNKIDNSKNKTIILGNSRAKEATLFLNNLNVPTVKFKSSSLEKEIILDDNNVDIKSSSIELKGNKNIYTDYDGAFLDYLETPIAFSIGDGAVLHAPSQIVVDNHTATGDTASEYNHAHIEAVQLDSASASVTTTDVSTLKLGTPTAYTDGNQTITNAYSLNLEGNIKSSDLIIDDSGDITLDAGGIDIFFKVGGTSYLHWAATGLLTLSAAADTDDTFSIQIANNGVATLSTVDDTGTIGHIKLIPDGDLVLDPASQKVIINTTDGLYFDGGADTYIAETAADRLDIVAGGDTMLRLYENGTDGNVVHFTSSAAGFTQVEPTFDATDTEVDFRHSNKQKLTLTDNCTDIHFQFPTMSGNFLCVLLQDGTGGRTISNWKTKDAAGNAGAGNSGLVLWAGGTAPENTETANKADIASFYWDADNEIAYGTYTYKF